MKNYFSCTLESLNPFLLLFSFKTTLLRAMLLLSPLYESLGKQQTARL
jgi:hypothetical protein